MVFSTQNGNFCIKALLASPNTSFSIPPFQRAYVWDSDKCEEFLQDLIDFAIPNGNPDAFKRSEDSFFIGNIVTIANGEHTEDIIDGRQRITTLLLIMRVLYSALPDDSYIKLDVGKCIWHTDERGRFVSGNIKIIDSTMFDDHNKYFTNILTTGSIPSKISNKYADNFRAIQASIKAFVEQYPKALDLLAARILDNVYVIRQSATTLSIGLQLFLTINAKGVPLTVADIFKPKLFEQLENSSTPITQEQFCNLWQGISERCDSCFKILSKLPPMDWLLLVYINAITRKPIKHSQLLKVLVEQNTNLLSDPNRTLHDLNCFISLLSTLKNNKDSSFAITPSVSRWAFILFRLEKRYWLYHLIAYFYFHKRLDYNSIDNDAFASFLERITAFLLAILLNSSANENVTANFMYRNIDFFNGLREPTTKFSASIIRDRLTHFYEIKNPHPTKRILMDWWTFRDTAQPLIFNCTLDFEHIFAKALAQNRILNNPLNIELPGNLALLETSLNRKAANLAFGDKATLYRGLNYTSAKNPKPTANIELLNLATTKSDFSEADIIERNNLIINESLAFLRKHNLLDE